MVNEFHTLNGACTTLVPQGPGYENVQLANQVCTTVGSQPGVLTVSGSAFIADSFGYYFSNLWRVSIRVTCALSLLISSRIQQNYGIIWIFCIGFLVILLVLSGIHTGSAFDTTVTLFKRGTSIIINEKRRPRSDEENLALTTTITLTDPRSDAPSYGKLMDEKQVSGTPDIFSWNHVHYVVPVSGGERQLLDDVCGYVAPGKLTALMGESGAGKVKYTACT